LIEGKWVYLHAGGAIGENGVLETVSVMLDPPLDRFFLPVPPTGETLATAVRASLNLINLCPSIMFPLLGTVYRSVLGPADFSLNVVGHSGLGKSEFTALAQQHFGAGMHRLQLPANWHSTANALEGLGFLAKDALLVIDDFKPVGSKADIDRMHLMADRVLRAQGNRSGRARCRADGTIRAPRPPRGTIVLSGEDIPRGESLTARQLTLRIIKGLVEMAAFTIHQKAAADGLLAAAMAAFISSLAPKYQQISNSLDDERAQLRNKARQAGHARTPGIIADLALGWRYFLNFAVEIGVLMPNERDNLVIEVWEALLNAAAQQREEIVEQDPGRRFLRLLASIVSSGRVHVTDRSGDRPLTPEVWGWRQEPSSAGDSWKPQGKQVGWVDGNDLFLDPEIAYAEVQRLGEEQGERLALGKQSIYRHLKEMGLLASHERNKTTNRRVLQGLERAVLHITVGALTPQITGGTGGDLEYSEVNQPPAATGSEEAREERNAIRPPVPPVSGTEWAVL
jgi:hypothetical protein